MADDFAQMQALFRKATGKRSASQMSDTEVKAALNSFYRLRFPNIAGVLEFRGWYSFSTVAGTGEYNLPATVIAISGPAYLDDELIDFYTDEDAFFEAYLMSDTDQDEPSAVLLFDRLLYVRSIPDDVYTVKLRMVSSTPTELTADADLPENELWSRAIAYGAAIEVLSDEQNVEAVESLSPLFSKYMSVINQNRVNQIPVGTRGVPTF